MLEGGKKEQGAGDMHHISTHCMCVGPIVVAASFGAMLVVACVASAGAAGDSASNFE
jgi:hypothetical protein